MPTFYNYTENGVVYSFDDVFVPADAFKDGNLFVWGRNSTGELGINIIDGVTRTSPVEISGAGANWKQIASPGYRHSAAIKTDGTLWAWGHNSYGSVGDGTTTQKNAPVVISSGATTWKQVDCGLLNYNTAAIKTDGTLWCWGYNATGQLGDGTVIQKTSPTRISVGTTNWKEVSCGNGFTAAIKTDGTLWAWGINANGQLGDGTTTQKLTPIQVGTATTWKQVSCGNAYMAAIKTDGTLWAWGYNFNGQLGDGTSGTGTNKTTPTQISVGTTNWKQVDCGDSHTTGIKTDGTLWLWGSNSGGKLGNGSNISGPVTTPIQTSTEGTNWKQVACGFYSTAAIKTDGTLWTWGANYGTLGDGTTTNRNTPGQTSLGGTNWKQVGIGYRNTAAITYINDYI